MYMYPYMYMYPLSFWLKLKFWFKCLCLTQICSARGPSCLLLTRASVASLWHCHRLKVCACVGRWCHDPTWQLRVGAFSVRA